MSKKEDNLKDKIDEYLADILPAEERITFEKKMATDEEFQKEVDLTRQIAEAFLLKGEKNAIREVQDMASAEDMKTFITHMEAQYDKK